MKAFFAALLVLLASLQLAASQCSGNGAQVNGACACYSGFSDESCSTDETSSSSCVFPTVAPLATQVVAEFMTGQSSIAADDFTFVIESPATSGRYFSSISLNGNENCTYPSAHYVKSFLASPDCKDVFTGVFSIPEVVDTCGFTETVGATSTTLSGFVSVSAVDPVGTFRGHAISRTTTSTLALDLVLPTFVNMSTSELEIYSPINTLAAVTRQEYDFEADTATIEVTVSVQWPYIFTSSAGSDPNPLSAYASSIAEVECTNTAGSDCLQIITYTISNIRSGARTCDFDGSYSLFLTYNCRAGQDPCPVSGQDSIEVAFNLTSGDICGSVAIQATISGEVKSYTDNSYSTERLVIVAGQRIFLRASVTADVTVQSLVVKAIRVVQGGVPVTIVVDDAAVGTYDPAISYEGLEGTVADNQRGVSFLATYGTSSDSLFDSSVADGVFAFTIEVDLEVTYRTTFISKRDVSSSMLTMSAQGVLVAPKL